MIDPETKAQLDKYMAIGYVFKSCDDWIVVLERTINTKTNENRDNVFDKRYAQFRGSKFIVKDIIHKSNPKETIEMVKSTSYVKTAIYKIGDIVKPDVYDNCANNVCSNGIHYYNDYEAAMTYEGYKDPDGPHRRWHTDGHLREESYLRHGKFHGVLKLFDESGQPVEDSSWNNGVRHGPTKWYIDGKLSVDSNWKNGVKHGIQRLLNTDGEVQVESNWSEGIPLDRKEFGEATAFRKWYMLTI